MSGLVILGLFIGAMMIGIPVAIALGVSAVGSIIILDKLSIEMIVQSLFSASDSFPLMAVPFFILTGDIMLSGGISKRLINFAKSIVGQAAGGLGIVTVVTCMIFASISGSGPATVAAIGSIMIPGMIRAGYDKAFTSTLTAAAGSMGPIIPPSISFIIFGVVAGVSITDLFIAGIVPGIFIAISLIIFVYFFAKKNNFVADQEKFNAKNFLRNLNEAKWGLLVPVIILGGIYSGIFTPTESAIISSVYALIIGLFIHKEIQFKDLFKIFSQTSLTSGYVVFLVGFATAFGRVLTMEGVPQTISNYMFSITDNKYITILLIIIFLVIIGLFIETLAAIIILTPLLLPIAAEIGMDPVHLGVILVVALAIGQSTPPVGVNLFVASGIAKIKLETMFKWVVPIVGTTVLVLILTAYIPALSLFLVDLLGK